MGFIQRTDRIKLKLRGGGYDVTLLVGICNFVSLCRRGGLIQFLLNNIKPRDKDASVTLPFWFNRNEAKSTLKHEAFYNEQSILLNDIGNLVVCKKIINLSTLTSGFSNYRLYK